jgi:hypothetical protein
MKLQIQKAKLVSATKHREIDTIQIHAYTFKRTLLKPCRASITNVE